MISSLSTMTSRSDFESDDRLTKYLSRQLATGNLCVVLGAGVSKALDLPDWKVLLEKMFIKQGGALDSSKALEREAERFRLTYFKSEEAGYFSAIRESLYEGIDIDFKKLRQNDTLAAIGALVMSSIRGSASEVVTFNFDNLLEKYLEYHGFVTLSVYEPKFWAGRADVTVLHPHGFIPFDPTEPTSSQIVFDQQSFAKIIGDEANPWRQKVLTLLRTHTCIFIGLSGDDLNLDSMLLASRDSHAGVDSKTFFWGLAFTTAKDTYTRDKWEERGIYCKPVADYDVEIPNLLFKICQLAAKP